jgi:hypothetical protein
MDLSTLQRKVQRTFGDDHRGFIREQDILDWVNDAQLQVVRQTNCLATETSVVANLFPWTIPSTMVQIIRVIYGTAPLRLIEVESLDSYNLDLTQQNTPAFYYFANNKVCLYPDPPSSDATAVTLQYSILPTEVVTLATALQVPAAYHEDLVRYCVARARERNEDYRGMEIAMEEFNNRIADRISETDDQDEGFTSIRDDPFEWI